MITCPAPHFYIVKLGFTGVYIFFALKHRLWVLVRTPTINVLSKNKKNITIFHLKIIVFTAVKNCSILHGRIFVMIIFLQKLKTGCSHSNGKKNVAKYFNEFKSRMLHKMKIYVHGYLPC